MSKLPLNTVEYNGKLLIQRFVPHDDPKRPGHFKTTWSRSDKDPEYQEAKKRTLEAADIFVRDLERQGEL